MWLDKGRPGASEDADMEPEAKLCGGGERLSWDRPGLPPCHVASQGLKSPIWSVRFTAPRGTWIWKDQWSERVGIWSKVRLCSAMD